MADHDVKQTEELKITDKSVLNEKEDPLVDDFSKGVIWPYVGNDGTTVFDVISVDPEEDESEVQTLVNNWRNKHFKDDKDAARSGVDLLKTMSAGFNLKVNLTEMSLTRRAIEIGKVMMRLKELVKEPGVRWQVWAEENLSFIHPRNRQKYARFARRVDCHKYAFVGIENLDHLCSVTDKSTGKDPIGTLLKKYSIRIDFESEVNLEEFKTQVNSAINSEKLLKNDIKVDFDLVKNLTEEGVKFDKSLVKGLLDIKSANGNPGIHLERMLRKESGEPVEEESGKIHLEDFNSLSSRLITAIDYITTHSDQIASIDRETFLVLEKKISELKKAANITTIDQKPE